MFSQKLDKKTVGINLVKFESDDEANICHTLEIKNQIIKMNAFGSSLYILDDQGIILTYQNQEDQLVKIKEDKIIEEFKNSLELINYDEQQILITDNTVFIGCFFYQRIESSYLKDQENDFESQRQKIIDDTCFKDFYVGPKLSSGQGRFMIIQFSQENEAPQQKETIQKILFQSKQKQRVSSIKQRSGGLLNKDLNEYCSDNLWLQIYDGPLLLNKRFNLMNLDSFMREQLQATSFTFDDDILIILKYNLMIYNKFGMPLHMNIDKEFLNIIYEKPSLSFISTQLDRSQKFQYILMKFNESDFLVLKLYKKDDIYRLVITQRIKKLVSTDFINKDSTSSLKIRLTSEGDVYQILIDRITTWQQYYVSFYKNEQEIEYIGKKIERILENNFDNLEEQKQKIKAKHLKQKLNKIFADLTSKAQSLIQEIDHDFIIVGRKYLVYQNKINIFYILLDDITENKDFEKININLRKGKISQLAEVQNRSQVQFVYHQSKPFKYNYIVTWDLDKNIEVQILELPYQKGLREDIRIYKGVSERLNYYIPQDKNFIYDIRFEYPCNMYQGELIQDHIISNQFVSQASYSKTRPTQIEQFQTDNTIKFSTYCNEYIGCHGLEQLQVNMSSNIINYQYMEYLLGIYRNEKNIEENTQVGIPILRHLNFSLDGNNFYHYLFNNFTFLKQSLREIKRQTSELNNEDAEYYIYYLLFMNNKDESPFDLSMKNFTPRSIDILLDILSINDNYDYFIFLKKHLFRLLEMKSDKFERFFDECSSVKSHNIRVPWKIQRDLAYFTHNTSYISDEFIIEKLKVKREDLNETEDGPNTKVFDKILLNQYDLVPDIDEIQGLRYQIEPGFNTRDLYMNTDKKSVVFETYDFGWILKDDTGQQFIQYLKNQRIDSALFTLKIVQTIINTQWKILRHKVVLYEFIPMCIQIILVLLYNTNLNRNLFTYHTFQKYSEQEEMVYQIIHYVIGALQTILAIYFVILEFNKYKRSKSRTVLGFLIYHISVIIATMLDIGLIGIYEDNTIKDFLDNPLRDIFKILSSVIVFWSYLMFLLQLRIFEKYAALINVIFYVIKGSNLFFIIFFLTLFGFGNTYYILATLDQYETPDKKLTGSDILTAFVFAYRIVLGDIQQDKFEAIKRYKILIYAFFLLNSTIANIVLLNLLISLLSDIYYQVMLVQSNERFKVKCQLIGENEFLFRRKEVFKNVKYIVLAELEKLKKNEENEWTGMINSIEKKVRITIEKEQEKTVRVVQSLKNKLREVGNTISKQQEFQFEIKQNFDTVKFAIEQIATSISDLKKQQEKLEEKVDSIQIIALENQNSEINQDKIEHKPEEPPQKMKRQKQVVKQKRRKESFQEKKQDNEDDLPNQTASKRLTRSYTNVFYLKNQVKIS